MILLQQYLPLAVLKLSHFSELFIKICWVATVLTACGIETDYHNCCCDLFFHCCNSTYRLRYWNDYIAIQRLRSFFRRCNSTYRLRYWNVVNAAFSIGEILRVSCNSTYRLRYWNPFSISKSIHAYCLLQQYLPLAVLKLSLKAGRIHKPGLMLQQYLPLAVLKPAENGDSTL